MNGVPSRSILLRPEPKGKGTGAVESLRSYQHGLAWLHGVTPLQLIWMFVPALRRPGRARKIEQYWNTRTELLAEAMAKATKRTDLRGLTLAPWQQVISSIGLRAKRQKWCSLCLKEDSYEHLSWTLACMESCPVHGMLLLDRCQKCGKQVNVRQTNPAWCICPVCRRHRSEDKARRATEAQNWVAHQVDRLLVAGQSTVGPDKDRIHQVWNRLILPHFSSVEDASASLRISRSIPDSVLYGDTRRCTLPILLSLCRKIAVNLDDFLLGDLATLVPQIVSGGRIGIRKVLPRHEVDRRLGQILRSRATTDLSIGKICREIGIATDTLRSRYPDLSKRLVAGFRHQRKTKREHNREISLSRMVAILKERGPKTSNWAIQRAGKFCTRRLWKEMCAEARNRAASERTKLMEHADACLTGIQSIEAKSVNRDKKGG